jgi:hypothetical protein
MSKATREKITQYLQRKIDTPDINPSTREVTSLRKSKSITIVDKYDEKLTFR